MTDSILWRPTDKYKTTSAMYKFLAYISEKYHLPDNEYYTIHKWSVNNTSMFWAEIWDWCDIHYSQYYEQLVDDSSKMPGAKWFSGARLNFAENLLRRRD
ncbi:MAG: hypothetical protein KDC05_05635, partial [Bacteroidales bacterium]|nr:hypothetical protein [Bacteroidales bacterium]